MSIRPPRVRMITFHSCHRLIYCRRFVQYRTLLCLASSSVSIQPHMRFLSVSASVCVRFPSDSTSRWTPLSFTNSSYCQVCSGLSPPSYHPCRAHQKNSRLKHYNASNGSMKMIQLLAATSDYRRDQIRNPVPCFPGWIIFVPKDYF